MKRTRPGGKAIRLDPRAALLIPLGIVLIMTRPPVVFCNEISADSVIPLEGAKEAPLPTTIEELLTAGLQDQAAGRFDAAIEKYKTALVLAQERYATSHIITSLAGLGMGYRALGRWQEAVEAYKQAIQLKPDYVEAHYNLGLTYAQLGRWPEAAEAYKQAIQLKPDTAEAYGT